MPDMKRREFIALLGGGGLLLAAKVKRARGQQDAGDWISQQLLVRCIRAILPPRIPSGPEPGRLCRGPERGRSPRLSRPTCSARSLKLSPLAFGERFG